MENNLFKYLSGQVIIAKKKKLKKKRKVRWGSKLGNKAAKNYSNKSSDAIDKLLTLVTTQMTQSPHDIARLKQIDSDFQVATQLKQEDDLIISQKTMENDMPNEAKERVINKYRGYGEKFEELESNYSELINQFTEVKIISPEAIEDYRNHIDTFRTERDNRNELLDDIKNNPHDLWEWKGFIENSEVQIGNLINIEEDANRLLFDKIQTKQKIVEEQLQKSKKQVVSGESDLLIEKEAFNQELLILTEQISQVNMDMIGIKAEKADMEDYAEELTTQLKQSRLDLNQTQTKLTDMSRREDWIAQDFIATKGQSAQTRVDQARMDPAELVHQYVIDPKFDLKTKMLQRAFETTGIGYPFPEQYTTTESKREYVRDRLHSLQGDADAGDFTPPLPRAPSREPGPSD